MKKSNLYIILFLMFTSFLVAKENISVSTLTAVKFNTVCAKCHEGQCSGRLSFDSGAKAAYSHINRYTKTSSDDEVNEFFTILKYMKKECKIFLPNLKYKENYSKKDILPYEIPSKKAYFIPLGILKIGIYTLKINIEKFRQYKVEVISEHFDMLLDKCVISCSQKNDLSYLVKEKANYYLRIQSKDKLIINNIKNF
ncbi:MAG: hypothetical protein K8R44_07030 [Sulfurimonas sp.]|nr:hypothetical protein [Sulfurimonas sp.]